MAVSCAYCSSPNHVWWDCPKKPDGWKLAPAVRSISMPSRHGGKSLVVAQAVENALDRGKTVLNLATGEVRGPGSAKDITPIEPKRGRGRPKSITDMRAYKAEKAKAYRARLKLAKPNEDQK